MIKVCWYYLGHMRSLNLFFFFWRWKGKTGRLWNGWWVEVFTLYWDSHEQKHIHFFPLSFLFVIKTLALTIAMFPRLFFFNKHCFNPFISVISIFQDFTVFIWSYCILCSVTPCICIWQKPTRPFLLFPKNCGNTLWVPHDGRLMGSFFFFLSPSEWGRGRGGGGGGCLCPRRWTMAKLLSSDSTQPRGFPPQLWAT